MAYTLVFTQRAVRDMETLDAEVRRRIGQTLTRYQQAPLQYARRMATPALGDYRFRIGDYRVIFDLDGDAIVVLRVGTAAKFTAANHLTSFPGPCTSPPDGIGVGRGNYLGQRSAAAHCRPQHQRVGAAPG